MTRPICVLLALLCSSAAADSSSALRGTSPIQRRLLNDHVINVQQSTVFERNDAIIRSGEEVDEQMEHRSLEEMTIIIPTIALEQTIDTLQSVNSSFAFTMKEKADDVIQSIAENHLAVVYADSFPTVGAPTKVLLTVVTNNDDEREEAVGIFVRKSFLGGLVTFPESSKTLSQSELEKVTLDAFTVPGLGQSFLDKLKDEKHPDLEGLLLINSKKLQQGGPVATSPDPPSSNNGNATEDTSPMSSIWAIAAVVALGAMLLTIILCTSILYCDYRKRKERVEQRRTVSSNHRERRKSRQSGSNKREKSSQSNNVVDHLEIVVPAASGETEVSASPSTQGSNEMGGNVVGRGSIRGSIFKSRRSSTAKSKSKAASTQLQDSTSIEENNYVAQKAPSEVYSVGEDTTMLYPAMNRARTTSKDNMSEDFDGYSMDGMSAMDGGVSTIGNDTKSTSRSINRDAMYAGDAGRDFDSIWDEQSKLTNDGVGSVDGPTKEAYGDLSKPLNELVENQDEENQSSAASVDFDSESESGSNIGKFTLELLGQGKSKKSGQEEEEEEDSILGGMYDDTSESGNVPSSGDSVDSTPSWAAPIQSAIDSAKRSSVGIFRTLSGVDDDSSKASSVNDKFVSSLSRTETDDESVKSGSSRGSRGSGSIGSRQSGAVKSSGSNALGYTNSADDEIDEHPDAMIDNINSMLSECRVILDKDGEK